MSPELKSAPLPASDSSFDLVVVWASHLTTPPAKIVAVVEMGRYEPTAKASERTPQISSATTMNAPNRSSVQGSLRVRIPLITTLISVA